MINNIGNNIASRYLTRGYDDAANILVDAYGNLKTIDMDAIDRNDYRAAHAMAALQAPIVQTGAERSAAANAVAMKYLNDADYLNLGVGFGTWMLVMIPIVLIIFAFAWFLLTKMYPFSMKEIKLKIDNDAFSNAPARDKKIICITFAVTILLWVTDRLTGINANIVALVPFAVLSVTGIFTKKDLSLIDWDVLWLVAGGFALGIGLEKTGLAKHMVESIPFGEWSPIVVMVGSGLLCLLMSTFMSNSASAALLLPIMYTVGQGMDLGAFGGVCTMLLGVALSASLAMALPISTPPNALAYSTGNIKQKDMATVGIIVGMFGFVLAFVVLIGIVGSMHIFG